MNRVHLCVLCVRNPSSSQTPWRCIYTLILEGDHLLVDFVGNLSVSLVPSRCTCTLIHCTGSLYVLYIRTRWWCPVHWKFEASNSWVGMTKFFYCMWSVTSLLGNSKLYILNPYSFRQCATIIMVLGLINSVWTCSGSCPFSVALGYCHYAVWLTIHASDIYIFTDCCRSWVSTAC